jgi:thioredoxin-related protein
MQFFFDAEGKPYGYHEGFLPEEDIIRILKEIGMK